ncbi:MAG: hypothetical protein KH142_01770 [Slackia piriformis]|uniref:Uncharacterized protein n=1 Tax=Slackia piriformis TaxID=626934 RepID=A0A943UWK9_9ACTN|nr:hypothetical protein [Slackia piriformis]
MYFTESAATRAQQNRTTFPSGKTSEGRTATKARMSDEAYTMAKGRRRKANEAHSTAQQLPKAGRAAAKASPDVGIPSATPDERMMPYAKNTRPSAPKRREALLEGMPKGDEGCAGRAGDANLAAPDESGKFRHARLRSLKATNKARDNAGKNDPMATDPLGTAHMPTKIRNPMPYEAAAKMAA